MPIVDGVRTFEFGEGVHARASHAYSPDDGRLYAPNKPRIVANRLPYNVWEPKVFFEFPTSETRMEYDTTGNNLLARQATFETEFPEFTRINIGFSNDSRSMFAYRLGPVSRKHFCCINAVHGNEIDGVNGAFKAMELLAREAEFQDFRDEWTIFFVPAMNPDGWEAGTRNLTNIGPNGLTVNLNRNWDWFWDEYAESAFESKGSSPESEVETQNLLTYLRTANGGNPVPTGVMMDIHANRGTGSRYQSRDRVWRELTNPALDNAVLPNARLGTFIDWYIWRTIMTLTTVRARNNNGPGLWVRYLRSRFRPHLHAYFSSIGWTSFAIEELKVDDANGFETFKHAADYRMDYILTVAQMVTATNWRFDDAVLLEQGGRNVFNNSEFEQWQPNDERPGNFTFSRSQITRSHHVPESQQQAPLGTDRFYDNGGSGFEIRSDTDVELAAAAEFTATANAKIGEVGFFRPTGAGAPNWHRFILDEGFQTGDIFTSPMVRAANIGAGAANADDEQVDIIGGGTAAPSTGAVATVTRVTTTVGAEAEANVGNLNTARMFHATTDNFLRFPDAPASRLAFVFGGFDSVGSRLTSIEIWDPNANSATNATGTLPVATAEMAAAYFPSTDRIYIFGGSTGVAAATTTIYEYNVGTQAVATMTAVLPVALKNLVAVFVPFNQRIYLFGGEDTSGNMTSPVYVYDPATDTIVQEDTRQNLGDDEGVEEPGGEAGPWMQRIGRWSGATLIENAADSVGAPYIAGGRADTTAGSLLASVYRYDPPDMIIGLPRESDFGYMRYSVAPVDRRPNPTIRVTPDADSFFRIDDTLTFSPSGATAQIVEYADDTTTVLRLENVSGTIQPADTFTSARGSGTVTSTSDDNFDTGLDETNQWEDPNSVWAGAGNRAVASGSGHLKFRHLPDFIHQQIDLTVDEGGGAGAEFAVIARGTFSGNTLTDGYRVVYDEDGTEWRLERVNASSTTVLQTLDVSSDANRQLNASQRALKFRCEDAAPVHLVVEFNSLSIFDEFDVTESRIAITGQVGVDGDNGHEMDDFTLRTAGWREGEYACTMAGRSQDGNVSGYLRQVMTSKDDSSSSNPLSATVGASDDFSARFVRNYYTLPPTSHFQYYRMRLDLSEGGLDRKEDGFRYYNRIYKDNQRQLHSGPCMVQGTLIPHSFIHPEAPAAPDSMTFPAAVDLDHFRLRFRWMPTFGFVDLRADMELCRLSIDANNYIRLLALQGSNHVEREYNLQDLHGQHDPSFRLEKVQGGSVVASVDVVCYYGYDNREPSMEREDDVLEFTITHFASTGGMFGLTINKYGTIGDNHASTDLTAYGSGPTGSLIYNGVGYFGNPRLLGQDQSTLTRQRKLRTLRSGVLQRTLRLNRSAVQSGDRDPTTGQRVEDNPYLLPENFNRADDANLGSDWDIIRQTGNGFNILTNKASGTDTGFERWDANPKHRDITFQADISVNGNGDVAGVFARYPNEFFGDSVVCAYGLEIIQNTVTTADLRIVLWWLDQRTILATVPINSYTTGTEYQVRFTLNGSSLTGTVLELPGEISNVSVNTTSTLFSKPGRLGIYCESPTAAVTVDNVLATALFPDSLD